MSRHKTGRLSVISTAMALWGAGFVLVAGPARAQATCNGLVATIEAAPGETVIEGTSGDDVIVGTADDDMIDGGGGNDVICGGAGDDLIFGGRGDDVILGDTGADDLFGGAGDDDLNGPDQFVARGRSGKLRLVKKEESIDTLDGGGHFEGDNCFVSALDEALNCELLIGPTGDDDLHGGGGGRPGDGG